MGKPLIHDALSAAHGDADDAPEHGVSVWKRLPITSSARLFRISFDVAATSVLVIGESGQVNTELYNRHGVLSLKSAIQQKLNIK